MIKMFNLDKWTRLAPGDRVAFSNPMPRTVRIDVNTPDRTAFFIEDAETGELFFLASILGRDTIEFSAGGAFSLMCQGSEDAMVYTPDGDDVSFMNDAPESFTKIVERRARNPELEAIVAAMSRNMEARLEQTARELGTRLARSQEAGGGQPPRPVVPTSAAPALGQTDGPQPSGPQAGPADSGREGGTSNATGTTNVSGSTGVPPEPAPLPK